MGTDYPYLITQEAIEKLTYLFNFPSNYPLQDWEYLVADSERIPEFFGAYRKNLVTTDEEKFTLMAVTISSIDNGLSEEKMYSDKTWETLEDILSSEFDIYKYLVFYWSVWDAEDLEDAFAISSFMRELSKKHGI